MKKANIYQKKLAFAVKFIKIPFLFPYNSH